MTNQIALNDLLSFLIHNKEKKFLITFHSMGDRDCIGAALGLKEYLSNSVIAMPDILTSTSRRVLEALSQKPEILVNKIPKDIFGVIIVDANNLDALGDFSSKVRGAKKSILFIDHHLSHKEDSSKALSFNEEGFNSTSSIIAFLLNKLGVKPQRDAAIAILNGIIADSFDFYNMHTLTFKQVAEQLEFAGISYSKFLEEFGEKVPAENRLLSVNDLKGATFEVVGDYLLATGVASTHASIAAETAIKVGADASLFWIVGPKEVSISARLRPPLEKKLLIHLGKMMQDVAGTIGGSGGGHPGAAGAYGPNKANAKKAVDKILFQLKDKLKRG